MEWLLVALAVAAFVLAALAGWFAYRQFRNRPEGRRQPLTLALAGVLLAIFGVVGILVSLSS